MRHAGEVEQIRRIARQEADAAVRGLAGPDREEVKRIVDSAAPRVRIAVGGETPTAVASVGDEGGSLTAARSDHVHALDLAAGKGLDIAFDAAEQRWTFRLAGLEIRHNDALQGLAAALNFVDCDIVSVADGVATIRPGGGGGAGGSLRQRMVWFLENPNAADPPTNLLNQLDDPDAPAFGWSSTITLRRLYVSAWAGNGGWLTATCRVGGATVYSVPLTGSATPRTAAEAVGDQVALTGETVELTYTSGGDVAFVTLILEWDEDGGGGAVSSVFGRTGEVVAQSGDYTPAQVGADPAGTAAAKVSTHEGAPNPHGQYQMLAGKDAAHGYAGLGADGKLADGLLSGNIPRLDATTSVFAGNVLAERALVSDPALSSRLPGDTHARFSALADGTLEWGPGTTFPRDTSLYRSGTGLLRTDGDLQIDGSAWASWVKAVGTANLELWTAGSAVVRIDTDNNSTNQAFHVMRNGVNESVMYVNEAGQLRLPYSGSLAGLVLGDDCNLYRDAPTTLRTDVLLRAKRFFADPLSGTDYGFGMTLPEEAYPRLMVYGSGMLEWSSGAADGDTTLYRSAAATLRTDGVFETPSQVRCYSLLVTRPSDQVCYVSRVEGDTTPPFALTTRGRIEWGDGAVERDLHLHRTGTKALSTNGSLTVQGSLAAQGGAIVMNGDAAGSHRITYGPTSAVNGSWVAGLNAATGDFVWFRYNAGTGAYGGNPLRITQTGEVYALDVYADTVGASNRDLYIDNTGKLGYVSSSRRHKKNIRGYAASRGASRGPERLLALRPVRFDYSDPSLGCDQVGLVAEEVEAVMPELVSYERLPVIDGSGEIIGYEEGPRPETVCYSRLAVHLLALVQDLAVRLDAVEQALAPH